MNTSLVNSSNDKKLKSLALLKGIWKSLKKRRKLQLLVLFFLIIVGGFSEIVTFSLFVPFLSIIQNPEMINDVEIINYIST